MFNDLHSFVKHICQMTISNVIGLAVGVLSAFIIPSILTKTDYGYYKIFILYFSYSPLLQLGFIDGVLLNNAGKKYDDLNLMEFRLYTKFYIILELVLSILMALICLVLNISVAYKIIFMLLSVYCFVDNLVAYYQFISKSILDFTEFSRITLVQSILNIFFILVSVFLYKSRLMSINFEYYSITSIVIVLVLLSWLIFHYRKITFGKSIKLYTNKNKIAKYFKSGFNLMFSYQIMNFMNNLDNEFISMLFKSSLYGTYAFAYSLMSVIGTLFGAVSSVLFPYMERDTEKNVISLHSKMISFINIVVFVMLIGFYPIVYIVHEFIPRYVDSLIYFKIVFPGASINCIIGSIIFNSYTYFHKFYTFMKISFINILFSVLLYILSYLYTKSSIVVAFVSIFSLFIWFISLEIPFKINYNIPVLKNIMYVFVMIVVFLLSTYSSNYVFNLILYIALYCFTTCFFYFKFLCNVCKILFSKLLSR